MGRKGAEEAAKNEKDKGSLPIANRRKNASGTGRKERKKKKIRVSNPKKRSVGWWRDQTKSKGLNARTTGQNTDDGDDDGNDLQSRWTGLDRRLLKAERSVSTDHTPIHDPLLTIPPPPSCCPLPPYDNEERQQQTSRRAGYGVRTTNDIQGTYRRDHRSMELLSGHTKSVESRFLHG